MVNTPLLRSLLLLVLLPASAAGLTRNVDGGNPACDDVTGSPYCTVQAAVSASTAGDVIVVAPGSYIEQITIDRDLTLRGAGRSAVAGTCDGATNILGASPISVLAGATATVSAVTVKGSFNAQGGGIFNAGTLTLLDSEVCENLASFQGGGIYTSGRLVMSDVQVYGNSQGIPGVDGGGLFVAGGGVALVNDSSFSDNRVSRGGGISVAPGGRLLLTDCLLTSNFADNTALSLLPGLGGGIYNAGVAVIDRTSVGVAPSRGNVVLDPGGLGGGIYNAGNLLVTKSAIVGNAIDLAGAAAGTGFGAGLYNGAGGSASLVSTTVSANLFNPFQYGYGAGIANVDGSLSLNNVTITDNANATIGILSGAGVYAQGGTVTVRNSIIAAQRAGSDCDGTIATAGHNIDTDGTCGLIEAAAGGTDQPAVATPGLLPLADYGGPTASHNLAEDSVALDTGDPAGCLADLTADGVTDVTLVGDQRASPFAEAPGVGGDPSGCDVGAIEFTLLANGMMEDDDDADRIPDEWVGSNLDATDRLFCAPRLAHTGTCFFGVLGSSTTTKQLIEEVERSGAAGDRYTLRVFTAGNAVTGTPVVRIQFDATQTFGIEEEFVLPLPVGSYAYAEQLLDVTTTSTYGYDVVRVLLEAGSGGALAVDDLSLVPHP